MEIGRKRNRLLSINVNYANLEYFPLYYSLARPTVLQRITEMGKLFIFSLSGRQTYFAVIYLRFAHDSKYFAYFNV